MAAKFHFQPKPVNDSFSNSVYTQMLKQLDGYKLIFTAADIKNLSAFRFSIDEEVLQKKHGFLSLITSLYNARLSRIDTMVASICKTPFNFNLNEKVTVAERDDYPVDAAAARTKLYKYLKTSVMQEILDEDGLYKLSPQQKKKFVDSLESRARQRVQKSFIHSIHIMQQSSGGIQQAIGDDYCKAIANWYDPHTVYFPPREKENFETELGQKSMVFGFTLKVDEEGMVVIDDLAPGGPAFKSGQFNKGDKIKSIQWKDGKPIDVSAASMQEIIEVLDISNHDKATFNIRKSDGSERAIVLWKEIGDGDEDKVKSFLLSGAKTIGFLSLPDFYEDWENEAGVSGCANDVAKEILKLKKENISGLILDLRYNGGGSMQEAVELAGIFIDAGPVGQYKTREAKTFTLKDVNRGTIYDGPLMILVNGYSASASEMIAGTLQDYNRAVIVGSTTYGKATAQVVLPMDTTIDIDKDDYSKKTATSYLKTTISQLYRTTGQTAQAKGVQPDIALPDLLDINGRREADENNVLISGAIEGNKYFKPAAPLAIAGLKTAAADKAKESAYFSWLHQYLLSQKKDDLPKDINLKLDEVIAERLLHQNMQADSAGVKNHKPSFLVTSHSFEKAQMLVNPRLKDLNEGWSAFLAKDPYVKMAYDLMLSMIK
jgi:carboxyl-terminal processing protease